MGTLWETFFGKKAPPSPKLRELAQAVDELRDDLEHLGQLHRKLAGQVRGSIRKTAEEPPGQPEVTEEDVQVAHGRILNRIRGARGILPR